MRSCLQLFSHKILQNVCYEINNSSSTRSMFGIVIDGTQDYTGKEQLICIRYIDNNFDTKEEFLGLYEMLLTTGPSLSKLLKDVLTRCQLPITKIRAQTYDGASNMPGKYHSCQVEIKRSNHLLHTHTVVHMCPIWLFQRQSKVHP